MTEILTARQEQSSNARDFIENNWPMAQAAAGDSGSIGAAIWLTARYLRENNNWEDNRDEELELVEIEVSVPRDRTIIVLEAGMYLRKIAGIEAEMAVELLAEQSEITEASEALEMLGYVVGLERWV